MQSWLSGISWSDYFSGIGIIAGGYYLAVVGIYYRRDLVVLAAGTSARGAVASPTALKANGLQPEKGAKSMRPGIPDTDLHRVHDLMEDLKPVFADMEHLLGKQDLLARVQARLHEYTPLIGSDFEEAVIHHIILESNEQGGIALHAEEIRAVWKDRG